MSWARTWGTQPVSRAKREGEGPPLGDSEKPARKLVAEDATEVLTAAAARTSSWTGRTVSLGSWVGHTEAARTEDARAGLGASKPDVAADENKPPLHSPPMAPGGIVLRGLR